LSDNLKYHYDEEAAMGAVYFIEDYCTHVKGELGGKPFILEEWQKDEIIKPLFGWKDQNGLRRYRELFIFLPRKNGKSPLSAAILLALFMLDKEPGAEIYAAANDREQVRPVHDTMKGMVRQSPELNERLKVFQSSITKVDNMSFIKAITAEAGTKHGFNASAFIYDELHAAKDGELLEVLETAVAARRQPLEIIITTAGFDKESICYRKYDYACKVRDGILEDDRFLPVIYEAPPDADIKDPETWAIANPNLDVSVKRDYFENYMVKMAADPTLENAFRRLHLNQWTGSETAWIPDGDWMRCGDEFDSAFLEGQECYAGLDLSKSHDLSSFVLFFPDIDGENYILPFFWCPEDEIVRRSLKDDVPYDTWAKQGYIEPTEGNVIDYDTIERRIVELSQKYVIKSIAFDRKYAIQIISNLINKHDLECSEFAQGPISFNPPIIEMENQIRAGVFNHGGHPILRWNVSNVMVTMDDNENKKFNKRKSKEKIDGAVAMAMAVGEWMDATQRGEDENPYEKRGIRIL